MPNYFTELKDGPSGPSFKVKDEEAEHSITALIEESPATEAHDIDTYLVYNHEIYHVKATIEIGDTLVVDTNIEEADLPEGTVVYTDDESEATVGSVAHVIVNSSGTEMPQRNKLKLTGGLEVTDDSANDTTVISGQKMNEAIEAMVNVIFTPGRDLTVVFADEIVNYSDEWAWIQARLDAHDVSGLHVGDYIPINIAANGGIAAETHKAEIAGINTYRRTGDSGHEVGYHIDWITRDCYSGTVQFNTSNNNNGNASNSSPFLASNLKSWLDGTLYPLLDAKLKAVIKAKRILAPFRYQSGATLTDDNLWGWKDFDKLWVPLEVEIFDSLVWSTKGFGNGQAVQYPIFANSYEHRMKGAGPGGARAAWWTASAFSVNSTGVVSVTYDGASYNYGASDAVCVPVCFRTMEA